VDLGVCRGLRFDRAADVWVILLPGANYPTTAPVLWFAREAALAAGRNVLAVIDSYDRGTDPQRWGARRIRHSASVILLRSAIGSARQPLRSRTTTHR